MLAAKGIDYELFNINFMDKPDWFFEMNPLGKAPVIELPNGKVLYESAICCGNFKMTSLNLYLRYFFNFSFFSLHLLTV